LAITVENVPGALAEVSSKMAEHNVNLLTGLLMAEPEAPSGTIIVFLDLTKADVDLAGLISELKDLDVVLDVEETVKKIGDMAVDGTTNATTFLGERVVILDIEDIGAMLGWLIKTFSSGGNAILFDMGKKAGSSAARKLRESYGLSGRELVETFLSLQVAAGWFNYEVSLDEEGTISSIRLYENFECLPLSRRSKKPVSQLVRGALAGVLEEAYGRRFDVVEVKCLAKGDEYCEFVVRPSR